MRANTLLTSTVVTAAVLSCAGCASVCCSHTPRYAQVAEVDVAFGRIFEARGELGQALAAYRQAARREPHRAEPYVRMAILHDKLGQFTNSAALYRQALQLDPGNPEIFADVGFSLYLQDRWDDAEMNLRQALAVDPHLPRAHNNLALVLAQSGRIPEALAQFQRGGCSRSDAHANVAFVAMTQGHRELAEEHYELAQSQDPLEEMHDELVEHPHQHAHRLADLFPPTARNPHGLPPTSRASRQTAWKSLSGDASRVSNEDSDIQLAF